jgi:hypothetical protein
MKKLLISVFALSCMSFAANAQEDTTKKKD